MTIHESTLERGSIGRGDARRRLLAEMPMTERRLRLAGISTAVLEGGDGPAIVLLHGSGEYAAKWMRVVPDLVRTHRVIAPDLPGHGMSEVAGPIAAERVLAWLGELIERTCSTRPVLVGQILGGAIAARFAIERGNRLARLVLADSLGLAPFQPTPEFGAALGAFLARPSEETHDGLWRRCAFDLDRMREGMGESWERIRAYNLDRARAPDLQAAQRSLMEQFGFPAIPADDLARIAVPTTLIWGRHDLATPLQTAESASRRHGWPLHVIEDAADDPPLEQPDAFVRTLRAALDSAGPLAQGESAAPTEVREAWDRIAAGYDAFVTPTHMWLGNEGLRRAGLRRGMRFLDVAAGSGALSIPAARLGARVLSVDTSPVMLDRLAERARKEGLSNLETRVMDGHALALEDDTFDVSGSQFGVMLFPDMPRGLAELARVTRPGGRVVISAYGPPAEIEFFTFFVHAVQAAAPGFTGPPMRPPPLPFQLQDPERLRRELATAGLHDVAVETVSETLEFESAAQLWAWLTNSNPIVGQVLAELGLTPEQERAVQRALEVMLRERSKGHGPAVLTNPVHIGVGRK